MELATPVIVTPVTINPPYFPCTSTGHPQHTHCTATAPGTLVDMKSMFGGYVLGKNRQRENDPERET
jgi:hypothetical protein